MVSKRLQEIPVSGTVAISNLVSQMKSEGVDVVSFSMGEPDFATPGNIVDACVGSLRAGFTHYTPSTGIPDLRSAVAAAARARGIPCTADNVLVTPTKQAIFMWALAYLDPGDEVLLPDPAWVSYEAVIRLAGAVPVFVPTYFEDGFAIDPSNVLAAITPRTKAVVLNTPSNPTGCVQPEAAVRALAEICAERGLLVLADEIYEHILYEGAHVSIASMPGMADLTTTVSGLSKTYAMTGWRIGWAIASDVKPLNKLQTHSVTCCTSFVQQAAVEALTGPQEGMRAMVREFRKRRDLALDLIDDMEGFECCRPSGAFYLFPRYDRDMPSAELASRLLKEGHVAVTPGRAFGPDGEGFLRISYATDEDTIVEGLGRIKRAYRSL